MTLKVAVSPFFGGSNWFDELTGITFEKSNISTLAVYNLSNIDPSRLENVRKAVRLNALILMEGSIEDLKANPGVELIEPTVEVKEPEAEPEVVVEEVKEVEAPAQEVEVKKNTKKKN